jgi:protein-disulfide isomerase
MLKLAFLVGLAGSAALASGTREEGDAVAFIGSQTITTDELDRAAATRLARLKSEEYAIRRQVLDELIERSLLENEAKERRTPAEQLLKQEVEANVRPVTEDQIQAVYESNPGLHAGKPRAEAERLIRQSLERFRLQQARRAFFTRLWEKARVRVVLSPPRVAIGTGNNPAMGAANAPVTIIEFADFQCSACARLHTTLRRLQATFEGKVKVVFRDYPLPMHPQAPKAAEAATCAGEQGRYWDMHDKLFENQRSLEPGALARYATEIGLDQAVFRDCLDSGRTAAEWQADMREGSEYGVRATPTLFINGRMLTGAQPYDVLASIVQEELSAGVSRPRSSQEEPSKARPPVR